MDLKEVGLLKGGEDQHWYYASKARALRRCLGDRPPQQVLDVGAGSGYFARTLLRHTAARRAICVDPGYATDRDDSEAGKPLLFRRHSPVGAADIVLLMDVIEHVDDDLGLLRMYSDAAQPGTRFIVSVPAFSWLWSQHDVFLEHRRRYTLKQAERVLAAAGLTAVRGFYFYGALFPAVAAQRLLQRRQAAPQNPKSDLRVHHPLTNRLLKSICWAESAIAPYNRAFGLSAFAVADKL